MFRSATVLIVLAGSLLLPSCVVPWPNREVTVEGASGEVLDAATGRPVENALVKVSYRPGGDPVERRTSSRGRYKVVPQMGPWAWGYFIGPISGQMFGLKPDLAARSTTPVTGLEVLAEGYRPFRWSHELSKTVGPPERIHMRASGASN